MTVLEAVDRQQFWPQRWLPDGRLEVYVAQWEKDRYEDVAQPEHEIYRYFRVGAAGELQEDNAGLPWWAGDGLAQRLAQTRLPKAATERPTLEVGPDGEMVCFVHEWVESSERKWAVYSWRGGASRDSLA